MQNAEWQPVKDCYTSDQFAELTVQSQLGFRGSSVYRFILKGNAANYFSETLNVAKTNEGEVILQGAFYRFHRENRISGYWGHRATTNLQFDHAGAFLSATNYNHAGWYFHTCR